MPSKMLRDLNSTTFDKSWCRSLSAGCFGGFCRSLGYEEVWGKFSEVHYWCIGKLCLLNFTEIGQTISPAGEVEDLANKQIHR